MRTIDSSDQPAVRRQAAWAEGIVEFPLDKIVL